MATITVTMLSVMLAMARFHKAEKVVILLWGTSAADIVIGALALEHKSILYKSNRHNV